ncbi:cytokinin hydroxylase-like [Macadamia integrifolia]|uniref:cytokinin hydroxylase-like n=1 Tax=Macadamia integrifolia TaxID=60698 RepID=UPI001C4F89C2|nr:cytokinin hydroxylase-like [Macadamia integrifolia]
MGFVQFLLALGLGMTAFLIFRYWVSPISVYKKLRRNGFGGPKPSFPLGNIEEMNPKEKRDSPLGSVNVSHDIHSTVFSYFARWKKLHGKVFVYWLGTEPFLYVADPEFLKEMSSGVMAKSWGKPNVFKYDRKPMFGNGLVMVEGDNWVHHRNVIAPALSPANLKAMATSMVESANKMLDQWANLIVSHEPTIEVERDITSTAAEIIAKTVFGINDDNGRQVFEKLRAMQLALFKSNRLVGVPFSKLMHLKQTLESKSLGKEIDKLLLSIITSRKRRNSFGDHHDLLGFLLADSENNQQGNKKKLTEQELVDECKTFFFGGHETTALAITWTLLLLALHPEWQNHLREEIKEVIGDGPLDPTMLARLKKMGWVLNEVLRLYPSAPNTQRQAREDIRVGHTVIPKGTNIWIDTVGMHHDRSIWGDEVHEFKPERFKDDPNGGCKHRMGYLPFGFGGRICVGRNLTMMEYKIVLTLILRRFSFSLSPDYIHSPTILLSLRPNHGLPLVFETL